MWRSLKVAIMLAVLGSTALAAFPGASAESLENTDDLIQTCARNPFDENGDPQHMDCVREVDETRWFAWRWVDENVQQRGRDTQRGVVDFVNNLSPLP